jgi:hypothetical protein
LKDESFKKFFNVDYRRFEEPIEENSLSCSDPLLEPKKPVIVKIS